MKFHFEWSVSLLRTGGIDSISVLGNGLLFLRQKCPSLYSEAPVNYEDDLVSISLFSIEGKNEVEFLVFGDKCLSVLVSSGFHNEVLQIWGLNNRSVYFLTVLGLRGPRSKCWLTRFLVRTLLAC